jgi:2-succinyl-5-enolpyruvyl-6-hydroxy-3-cyclohexene-1-carboxylate synthase
VIFELEKVAHVFFCTGARNHELLKVFDPSRTTFEYDERMASFKALGLARISGRPVVICCTSGTAVAECIPALLEAQYSGIPLVLISGDRPVKMHGTGAPQTIRHKQLTENVAAFIELPIDELASFSRETTWPLHLNVLVDDTIPHQRDIQTDRTLSDFQDFFAGVRSPLFIFSHEVSGMRSLVEKFSRTGHAFYAETLSGAKDLSLIKTERDLIRAYKLGQFDSIVRIGHTPLSKLWRLLEINHLPVFSFDGRNLPGLSYGMVAPISSERLLQDQHWWSIVSERPEPFNPGPSEVDELLREFPNSEMSVMKCLQDSLPEDSLIYLGNSLVVRFFELVQSKKFRVHGNRGVNGIDGQLATAIGIALGTKETVTCILGDITTLYDLSSLREMPQNLKLVIMNNSGGRIFDMLGLDQRIILEHDMNFEQICKGLGLSYAKNDLTRAQNAQVTELFPDRTQTSAFLKVWSP